ncbi:MAG: protein translocase subunit SecF [Gemmatimonadetes bacterium]|nr:protein translocase subunit SecF [Gemmatimonadota bacterium]NNM03622.1 protein translocase subunit SecF [Gemmatimonadota bacterium]
MRIFSEAHYEFIQARKKAYVVSGVLLLVAIAAMAGNIALIGSWQKYGVDFTGGSLIQVRFEQAMTAGEIRDALGGANAPEIARIGSENDFTIRAPVTEGVSVDEVRQGIQEELGAAFGSGSFEVLEAELVSAKVGDELQRKAAFAIIFSFFLTLIYIAIRFELRFGIAAIIATVHDILLTLGFLALFRVEIALPTVAALLTIVGYSLNDTIVVFDRIRENLNRKGGRKEDPAGLVNRSINETLPRTVLTSGTTLAVLLALFFLGGTVIRDFTLVLILGVMIGTYSSIFVASPALLEIQKRFGTGDEKEKERARRRRKSASAPV